MILFRNTMQRMALTAILLLAVGFLRAQELTLIPQPQHYSRGAGAFSFNREVVLKTNLKGSDKSFLRSLIQSSMPVHLAKNAKGKPTLSLVCTGSRREAREAANRVDLQGYSLEVGSDHITAQSPTPMGLFYAVQTLAQLLQNGEIACCTVRDEPRFAYRGLMLDCSRHFWSRDFIKKQIDAMARYKLDRLHLHLTDAGGWRMEIKKYPLLTRLTAYRTASDWDTWWVGNDRHYCSPDTPGAYGGYYTQDDLRDIVRYAAQRHITVIPEIEMPGHSEEVCYAYPKLSCSGKPYVNSDLCVGNEETFKFIEDVLTEVMRIFPSEYIHIGGDEAGRKAWETCPKCQRRMSGEHLSTTAQLQSYLTARVERFLNKHGRKLLGWDEILEGQIAPNAAVMSWRGELGGIEAASKGHHVVMTPGSYCYLDRYQDEPESQPKALGSYMPLDKVYSYDPVPQSLKSSAGAAFVDGVQGNLWTEQVPTESHCEYMLYPRLLAIAEVGWTTHKTSFADFHRRALHATDDLKLAGYRPFDLRSERGHRKEFLSPVNHEGKGKKVVYNTRYSDKYVAVGDKALTDGLGGDWNFADGRWQGFIGDDGIDVVVDMGAVATLRNISVSFMQSLGAMITFPKSLRISVSEDGESFKPLIDEAYPGQKDADYVVRDFGWKGRVQGRYVRLQATPTATDNWLFIDEIVINRQ